MYFFQSVSKKTLHLHSAMPIMTHYQKTVTRVSSRVVTLNEFGLCS